MLIAAAVALLAGVWATLVLAALTQPEPSLRTGLATVLRGYAVIMLAMAASLGGSADRLARALVAQCRVPYRYAYAAAAALRFVPRYRADLVTLRPRIGPAGSATHQDRSAICDVRAGR